MPIIIRKQDVDTWLYDEGNESALHLIHQYQKQGDIGWQFEPVSTAVNNPRHDDATNIIPLQ
jgi:putative SOS response-associated peptidase YedK